MSEESQQNIIESSSLVKRMLDIEVFPVLSEKVIITTEDKLRIVLSENIRKAERKNNWIAPLSLLLTLIITLASVTFKDFILPKNTWEALFILVCVCSFLWLLFALKSAFYNVEIDKIIDQIKVDQNDK